MLPGTQGSGSNIRNQEGLDPGNGSLVGAMRMPRIYVRVLHLSPSLSSFPEGSRLVLWTASSQAQAYALLHAYVMAKYSCPHPQLASLLVKWSQFYILGERTWLIFFLFCSNQLCAVRQSHNANMTVGHRPRGSSQRRLQSGQTFQNVYSPQLEVRLEPRFF